MANMNPESAGRRRRQKQFQNELPVHERIRNRREARRLSGVEMARRAGVSPAYVSLIERGLRVPDEGVALAIARVLEDDPDLYRHWALTGRFLMTRDSLDRVGFLTSQPGLRRSLAAGDDLPAHRINLLGPRTVAAAKQPGVIAVPVLAPGTDPGRPGTPLPRPSDQMAFDARLLPKGAADHLFAYLVTEATRRNLGPLVSVGDCLVMTRQVKEVRPDRIHAVRTAGGITLSRALVKGGTLLLLPASDGSDVELIAATSPKAALALVAAASVLAVRRWG